MADQRSNEHVVKAQYNKEAAKSDASEAIVHATDAAKEAGGFAKEKLLAQQDYLAAKFKQKGSEASENVVLATSYLDEKVEEAGDYLSENVVIATEKAKDQWDDTAEKLQKNYKDTKSAVRDTAKDYANYVRDKSQQVRKDAEKAPGYIKDNIQDAANSVGNVAYSYYDWITSPITDGFSNAYRDVSRSVRNFRKSLYRKVDKDKVIDDRDLTYLDSLAKRLTSKSSDSRVSEALKTIHDTLSSVNAQDAFGEAAEEVKDTASKGYDKVTKTYQSHLVMDQVSEAIEEAYEGSHSPRRFWRNVYNYLEDNNNPVAYAVQGLGSSPIPVTSFYFSLLTLFFAASSIRSALSPVAVGYTQVRNAPAPHENEKSETLMEIPVKVFAYQSPLQVFEAFSAKYSWLSIYFLNLLILELNGYSSFFTHFFVLSSLGLEFFSNFVYNSQYRFLMNRVPVYSLIAFSTLNFLTSVLGYSIFN